MLLCCCCYCCLWWWWWRSALLLLLLGAPSRSRRRASRRLLLPTQCLSWAHHKRFDARPHQLLALRRGDAEQLLAHHLSPSPSTRAGKTLIGSANAATGHRPTAPQRPPRTRLSCRGGACRAVAGSEKIKPSQREQCPLSARHCEGRHPRAACSCSPEHPLAHGRPTGGRRWHA